MVCSNEEDNMSRGLVVENSQLNPRNFTLPVKEAAQPPVMCVTGAEDMEIPHDTQCTCFDVCDGNFRAGYSPTHSCLNAKLPIEDIEEDIEDSSLPPNASLSQIDPSPGSSPIKNTLPLGMQPFSSDPFFGGLYIVEETIKNQELMSQIKKALSSGLGLDEEEICLTPIRVTPVRVSPVRQAPPSPRARRIPRRSESGKARRVRDLALADHSNYCVDPAPNTQSTGAEDHMQSTGAEDHMPLQVDHLVDPHGGRLQGADCDSGFSGSSRNSSQSSSPDYPGHSYFVQPPRAAAAAATNQPPKKQRGRKPLPKGARGSSKQDQSLQPVAIDSGQPSVGALPRIPKGGATRMTNPKSARAVRRGQGQASTAEAKLLAKQLKNSEKASKERERRRKSKNLLEYVKEVLYEAQPQLRGKRVSHKATLDGLCTILYRCKVEEIAKQFLSAMEPYIGLV